MILWLAFEAHSSRCSNTSKPPLSSAGSLMAHSPFQTDQAFRTTVEALLHDLMLQADEIDFDDLDVRLTPGNLQIIFEDSGSTFVLSQQTPTHELWLSANLTAWHFRCDDDGLWRERDSNDDMLALLSRLVSEKVGLSVSFSRQAL